MRKDLNCPDIQSRMNSLKTLKEQFDIAYRDAQISKNTKDIIRAQSLKIQLQDSLEALKQPLFQHCIQEKTLLDYPLFSENIARNKEEIDEKTKVYIGPPISDLFQHRSPTIDYIYTKYPEQRIYREDLEVGGHSVEVIKAMFTKKGFKIGDLANKILNTPAFKQSLYTDSACKELKQSETLNLIHITVEQLGFKDGATTQEIFTRAQELGLQLCPPSVGPYYRLQYTDQPKGEWRIIGMDPINISVGLRLFDVDHGSDDRWLVTDDGRPGGGWNPVDRFVFVAPSRPA